MAEMISKWEVVGNLIAIENEYQFRKDEWDAQTLYRKICELEMAIGKRTALDLVRCKDCKHLEITGCYGECGKLVRIVKPWDFCSHGERKENGD